RSPSLASPVRLPPGTPHSRHTTKIDCPPAIVSCKARKRGGNHFPKRCCRNATRAEGSKTTGLPRLGRLGSLGIVRMDFRFVGRAVVQRRSLQLLSLPEGDLAPFLAVPINRSPA